MLSRLVKAKEKADEDLYTFARCTLRVAIGEEKWDSIDLRRCHLERVPSMLANCPSRSRGHKKKVSKKTKTPFSFLRALTESNNEGV